MKKALLNYYLILFLFVSNASAQLAVYDPANHAENVMILQTNLQTLLKETEMMRQGITNLLKYGGNFQDISPLLLRLRSTLERGDALSYSLSNIDQAFEREFDGYRPTEDWSTTYENWSKVTLDTFRNTLSNLNIQSININEDTGHLEELEALSNSAEGRDQILQTSNMLTSHLNKQLLKLRELMMTQVNSQNVYLAKKEDQEAKKEAALKELFSKEIKITNYREQAEKTGIRPFNPARPLD